MQKPLFAGLLVALVGAGLLLQSAPISNAGTWVATRARFLARNAEVVYDWLLVQVLDEPDMSTPTPPPPQTRTRYGSAHPDKVDNPIWQQSVKHGWSGYGLKKHLGVKSSASHFRYDFSQSSYREAVPGPYWSWDRFGRTSTALTDGRIIHIAGEHEDAYDPDFCIYNDVVVEYPDGRREFYLYPKDVFPPTDFHSATLVGDAIVLIGSLGYRDMRRVGDIQVLKLDTRTLEISTVATKGDNPGWLSRHTAERISATSVLVVGGNVQTANDYEANKSNFELDLTTMTWQRRPHADTAVFPVADAVYRQRKSPRYGTANPERSENPFWLAMARQQWPPSRARLHYGDFAPPRPQFVLTGPTAGADTKTPEPGSAEAEAQAARIGEDIERSKLKRTINDVVWTAVREEPLRMTLANGHRLLIGGEVPDYGDEYADPWVYNDIIVTRPDGTVEIMAYPKDVFPHIAWPVGVEQDRYVYIFGIVDRKRHPDRSRGPAVLRLDTQTYAITELAVMAPADRVNVYHGGETRTGNQVVFPLVRETENDPHLVIGFDLKTHTWGQPYPAPAKE
jgi:hypothetical protein